MALPVYKFKRPSDGEEFDWSPLTAGDEMDLEAIYGAPNLKHQAQYALMAWRLRKGGKRLEVQDMRAWESFDVKAFLDEMVYTEAARAAAWEKPGRSVLGPLEEAVAKIKAQAIGLSVAADQLLAAARAANVPLGGSGQ